MFEFQCLAPSICPSTPRGKGRTTQPAALLATPRMRELRPSPSLTGFRTASPVAATCRMRAAGAARTPATCIRSSPAFTQSLSAFTMTVRRWKSASASSTSARRACSSAWWRRTLGRSTTKGRACAASGAPAAQPQCSALRWSWPCELASSPEHAWRGAHECTAAPGWLTREPGSQRRPVSLCRYSRAGRQ